MAAGDLEGYIGPVMVMRLMFILLSTLSTPLLLRYSSFVGVFKSVADVLKGIRSRGFAQARLGGFAQVLGCRVSSWSLWSYLLPSSLG